MHGIVKGRTVMENIQGRVIGGMKDDLKEKSMRGQENEKV